MQEVTLGLAVLLATGMLVAKAGQLLKLPSVTGYILAGLLLGPSGFRLVTAESVGHSLDHFTQIALMLIAFGIGEQIELKRVHQAAKSITLIGCFEATAAFLFVSCGSYVAARLCGVNCDIWRMNDYFVLSLLLGSVSGATAPATTLHVMREIKAKGPLTSTLMAVVAIDNGLAIIFFGLAMSIAGQVIGAGGGGLSAALLKSILEITLALLAGVVSGLAISFVLHRLKGHGEMLTAGLALLLLCGELCRLFHLSPLLAGMAAGFTVINRVTRDVRLFRALNAFEPPIYVLFFTLAGTHLDLSVIGSAGWVGLVYFAFRVLGKYCGAFSGAWFAGATIPVRNYLGLALVPQAGVAIGLIFLIGGEPGLAVFAEVITPVVLVGVMLSELSGPVCGRIAVAKAGEIREWKSTRRSWNGENNTGLGGERSRAPDDVGLVPWTWNKLQPHDDPDGVVVFGASHPLTVCGLARVATILAHHYRVIPMSVRVLHPSSRSFSLHGSIDSLFSGEKEEVNSLGYELATEMIPDRDIASGLVAAVEYNLARAVVLGYPLHDTVQGFQEILEKVAKNVACPVVVVRFYGEFHTEKILVPVRSMEELNDVEPIVHALSRIGEHRLTLLYLLSSDESDERVEQKMETMKSWAKKLAITSQIDFQVERTEARQETILHESERHDLVVMGFSRKNLIKKLFFGSLAETVARSLNKPLLIVYRPKNEALLPDS